MVFLVVDGFGAKRHFIVPYTRNVSETVKTSLRDQGLPVLDTSSDVLSVVAVYLADHIAQAQSIGTHRRSCVVVVLRAVLRAVLCALRSALCTLYPIGR